MTQIKMFIDEIKARDTNKEGTFAAGAVERGARAELSPNNYVRLYGEAYSKEGELVGTYDVTYKIGDTAFDRNGKPGTITGISTKGVSLVEHLPAGTDPSTTPGKSRMDFHAFTLRNRGRGMKAATPAAETTTA